MADELDFDLVAPTDEEEQQNKVEKRIKSLSEKVKLTSQERDDLAKAKAEAEAKALAAQKDVDFFKTFNTLSSKYPGANEYQDKIREKVLSGYDAEDATISILAKEGKYTPTVVAAPEAKKESPAGGSALNTIKAASEKPLAELTQEERRKMLEDNLIIS